MQIEEAISLRREKRQQEYHVCNQPETLIFTILLSGHCILSASYCAILHSQRNQQSIQGHLWSSFIFKRTTVRILPLVLPVLIPEISHRCFFRALMKVSTHACCVEYSVCRCHNRYASVTPSTSEEEFVFRPQSP